MLACKTGLYQSSYFISKATTFDCIQIFNALLNPLKKQSSLHNKTIRITHVSNNNKIITDTHTHWIEKWGAENGKQISYLHVILGELKEVWREKLFRFLRRGLSNWMSAYGGKICTFRFWGYTTWIRNWNVICAYFIYWERVICLGSARRKWGFLFSENMSFWRTLYDFM